ncbi:MAG: glycosyltransferase family 4 protein [Eubacterium sp.]|nr:glycosyltransferase family 4 protein [Eubacterium sp.]
MKVLICTDWYKPVINGVVTSVVNLAEGLQAQGAEVRILTLSPKATSYQEENVIYIGSFSVNRIYPKARMSMIMTNRFIRELIEWEPDVVHSQCEFSTFTIAKKIADDCACPLVHTYHTVYEDFTHYFTSNRKIGKWLAEHFSRIILRKADYAIVPSRKIEIMLQGYKVKTPMSVIPSGLDLRKYDVLMTEKERNSMREKVGLKKDDIVLLFLGRMAYEKNIDELIRLIQKQSDPRVKLLLVGDGPYRGQLEEKVKKLNLTERVIFTGMVPADEVCRYYQLGDIFSSASRSETQGLTFMEGMASGLPLLCRDDPCLAEVVVEGKNGMTYENDEDFYEKFRYMTKDETRFRNMGVQARKMAYEKFSTEVFAKSVLKVYTDVIAAVAGNRYEHAS